MHGGTPGLRAFTRQLETALLGLPGDLFLTIRMARAGVRFARLEESVYDYYPGTLSATEAPADPPLA